MTDSEIQTLAAQIAALNKQTINDELDRRLRLPSGVDSGGPYGSFTVNDQGMITSAGGGVRLLVYAEYTVGQNIAHSPTRLDLDDVQLDVNGVVTTGSSWHFEAQEAGFYVMFVNLHMTTLETWDASTTIYGLLQGTFDNTSGAGSPPFATGTRTLDRQYPDTGHDIAMFLHGWSFGYMNVGDTCWATASQQSHSSTLVAGVSSTDNSSIAIAQVLIA